MFLSPALLWGLLFALTPIIIHLFFRQRYRRIDWAPMKYLKLSLKKTKRRIQIEQLLLLLVRVLASLLLFLTVARPLLQATGLGAWLASRSRTSQYLLIDDSLSMGYLDQGKSAFERSRELARNLVENIGAQDRLTLLLTSRPNQPLLLEVEVGAREEILKVIDRLQLSDTLCVWSDTFESADRILSAGSFPIRELTILTDLRKEGWDAKIRDVADRWASQQVQVRILDTGAARVENVSLLSLEQTDRVALAGAPTRWEAEIHNGTDRALEGVDAVWSIDGKPGNVRLPTIAPQATVRVPIYATFLRSGLHRVYLELPADELPGDNRMSGVSRVRDGLKMLLVDGEPSAEPFQGEVDFLALSLSLGLDQAEAWQVEIAGDTDWSRALAASPPDLLVLANLATISPDQAEQLRRFVDEGGGVMVFVGDQLAPDTYNQLLFLDGKGLLPARLVSPVDGEIQGLTLEEVSPSPLEAMNGLNKAVLQRIKIRKHMQLAISPEHLADGQVRVLARWNNPEGAPAAVERRFGLGRVALWTTTADKAWGDWPTEPSYVLAMREAAKGMARGDSEARQLPAGQAIRRTLVANDEAQSPTILAPGAETAQPALVEPAPNPQGLTNVNKQIVFRDTSLAGFYTLSWKDARSVDNTDVFAVQGNRRESQLARAETKELKDLFGSLAPEIVALGESSIGVNSLRGQEIWRSLALGLLALFFGESLLAAWVGRQR